MNLINDEVYGSAILNAIFKYLSCLNDTRLLDSFVHLDRVPFLEVRKFFQCQTTLRPLASFRDFLLQLPHCVQETCFQNIDQSLTQHVEMHGLPS